MMLRVVLSSADSQYIFKVKGEKHKSTGKQLAKTVDDETYKDMQEFATTVANKNRLQQGINYMKEMQIETEAKNTKVFLDWVWNDIMKEEFEVISSKGFDLKQLRSTVTKLSTKFYQNLR